MYTIHKYAKAETLEEAFALNAKKANVILGGTLWLRQGSRMIQTAIDLDRLGLDKIEETADAFVIGCMVKLRDLELSEDLNDWTQGAVRASVQHIVGTQFRNCATIGGSIFGRFGFSDILTCLLALETEVELYQRGTIPLAEFINLPPDNDILVHIIIKKLPRQIHYEAFRAAATDFPLLTCAVSLGGGGIRTAIGARPGRAVLLTDPEGHLVGGLTKTAIESYAAFVEKNTAFGKNMRASAAYRRALAPVLVRRSLEALGGEA